MRSHEIVEGFEPRKQFSSHDVQPLSPETERIFPPSARSAKIVGVVGTSRNSHQPCRREVDAPVNPLPQMVVSKSDAATRARNYPICRKERSPKRHGIKSRRCVSSKSFCGGNFEGLNFWSSLVSNEFQTHRCDRSPMTMKYRLHVCEFSFSSLEYCVLRLRRNEGNRRPRRPSSFRTDW